MKRTEIINRLIKQCDGTKYLEIGVSDGVNFNNIECAYKLGVDPAPESPATMHTTSDKFFETNNDTFDVIFIDGLHHSEQVLEDIWNSLNCLTKNGYIVLHDLNPQKKEHQTIPFTGGHWNGDSWKAFVKMRREYSLKMCTLDTDEGCGIIQFGKQTPLNIPEEDLTYENFDKNRKEWLNLMTTEEFFNTNNEFQQLLDTFILDPEDAEINWQMALAYHTMVQSASAIGYYIRTVERTDSKLLQYECFLRAAMCFADQGIRKFSVKGMLQHAVALYPNRPEAYYMLGMITSNEKHDGNWFDSYVWATLGINAAKYEREPLRTTVDYPGEHVLRIQQAHASWWCGMCDEARNRFLEMFNDPEFPEEYRPLVKQNCINLNAFYTSKIIGYTASDLDKLKVKFYGVENITQNYSESLQDMFVLTMLNGKRKGTYLEVGSGDPTYGNNTYLLETDFSWKGVSLDINEDSIKKFKQVRNNPAVVKDATSVNMNRFLSGISMPKTIDYLQIDCDPPEVSYQVLLNIPFDDYRFAVVTFEHDYYADETKTIRDKAKKYLESYGYVCVVNNISPDDTDRPYEDWWVHPELVDQAHVEMMQNISDETKPAHKYMMVK